MVNLFINKLGEMLWEYDGKIHRMNRPAQIFLYKNYNNMSVINGWWYKGNHIDCKTQEEFDRLIKLRLLW